MTAHAGSVRSVNALTIDVEDWFQVQNFAGRISRADWESCAWRVEANTSRILDQLAAAGVRATFFTLGWVAERYPALLRRIVAAGHELASHGHWHELVRDIGPARFRDDLRAAKAALEQAASVPVLGYRAPTFSLAPGTTPWAHAILAETGHGYSSSVFPGRHGGGPVPPLDPWWPDPAGVVELPMTVLRAPLRLLPVSGGGWFRLTPYPAFRAALRRVNARGRRAVFYFHPWEIDGGQPRVAEASPLQRFKHYHGIEAMEARLELLLRDFAWDRMDRVFAPEVAAAPADRLLSAKAA
jgi:polysaccharide deacetylase family protein (PEP-CTERM system associated)